MSIKLTLKNTIIGFSMATIITHPKKCTFIHIPKNGTSSIAQWLKENTECYEVKRRHDSATVLREKYGHLGWTFCTVRNPWDRMVSIYYYSMQEPKRRIEIIKQHNGQHPKSYKLRWTIEYNEYLISQVPSTFEEYILGDSWRDQQQQQAMHKNVDCIMKLENIDRDFVQFQDIVECHVPLPKKNISNHQHYRELYTDKMKDMVYHHFKSDINLYGYEF